MKLWKKLKNWRLSEKDKSIYLPLEPIHLQLDLELNLEKLKFKSFMRYFALAVFRCPDRVHIWGVCSLCFIYSFTFQYSIIDILHMWYIAYMIYRTCDIYRICDIVNVKYHICPILLPT